MSKLSIAIWGGIGATTFGLFSNSFPPEWGGQVGLLALIAAVILPLSWALRKIRLAKVR